jgi:hypothetical protein
VHGNRDPWRLRGHLYRGQHALPGCYDPAAEAISAIGSIAGEANENDVAPHEMKKAVRSVRDPVGTFYRFTLPSGFLNHAVDDKPKEEQP